MLSSFVFNKLSVKSFCIQILSRIWLLRTSCWFESGIYAGRRTATEDFKIKKDLRADIVKKMKIIQEETEIMVWTKEG